MYESGVILTEMVRSAAKAKIRRRFAAPASLRNKVGATARPATSSSAFSSKGLVAIGASTGGTEALTEILTAMPSGSPPIVVVQHMPEVFTAAFANRLNQLCQIEVKEAEHGDRIAGGKALIAPGNRHMSIKRRAANLFAEISEGPLVSRHRPSVDVLFRSVAQAAGSESLGIILTGMGNDGAQGLLEMKNSGAQTIAQDEASCVVFGMPKEAIQCGAVDVILPLSEITARLQLMAGRTVR